MGNAQKTLKQTRKKPSIARKATQRANLQRPGKENKVPRRHRSTGEQLRVTGARLDDAEIELNKQRELTDAEIIAHNGTHLALQAAEHQIAANDEERASLHGTVIYQQEEIKTARRRNNRLREDRTIQEQLRRQIKTVLLPMAEHRAHIAEAKLAVVVAENELLQSSSQKSLDEAAAEDKRIHGLLEKCQAKVRAMQMQVIRTKHQGARQVDRARARIPQTYKMKQHGAYTVGIRMAARALTRAGCSQEAVGPMVRLIGNIVGVKIIGKLTRRTVSRCIREGGIAARLQLGAELALAKSFTTSSDGTSHRNITYDSRHLAYKVPVRPGSETMRSVLRVMSVTAAVNHTAATQVKNTQADFKNIVAGYSKSPLGKRSAAKLRDIDMQIKYVGGMGDHAADQKSTSNGNQAIKVDAIQMDLGSQALLSLGPDALIPAMFAENAQKYADAGGEAAWANLSVSEQVGRDVTMFKRLTVRLGKEELTKMPEVDRRKLLLFVWAGCSMHKELNSVKCANKQMMGWWKANNIPGPIQLANRDNAEVLREMVDEPPDNPSDEPDTDFSEALVTDPVAPTKAQQRAMDVTAAGGVKATSIAGAILNHKDDKKGQQDTYRMYFHQVLGHPCNFPDTSSIRYHCYCAGAAELIAHTPEYIQFLHTVKMSKAKPGFNHMEANLWAALHDPKTKSELAVLAVYLNTVSAPYARFIRGPGSDAVNMLDLGPYHTYLKTHIKKLINDPDLAIGPKAVSSLATLDGEQWHHPDSMAAVLHQRDELPYLQELFVAFMEEALVTWERFTAEFQHGGLIDSATQEEKDLAWLPTTNDHNEGRLGAWRLYARTNPSSTIEQYNNIAMYTKNETQLFMDANYTPADHQHLMHEGRIEDSSGATAKRREEHVDAFRSEAAENTAKAVLRTSKNNETAARIAAIVIITDRSKIAGMLCSQLDEQLEAHRSRDREVPIKARVKPKDLKLVALLEALERFERAAVSSDYASGSK